MMALFVVLFLFVGVACAGDKVFAERVTVDEVVSVYDADTLRVRVNAWPPLIGDNMPVRVLGIDAPEIRGKCEDEKVKARAARDYAASALLGASRVELRNIRRGKYFRLLADVFVDGVSLADELVKAGHARGYDGGGRSGWCV